MLREQKYILRLKQMTLKLSEMGRLERWLKHEDLSSDTQSVFMGKLGVAARSVIPEQRGRDSKIPEACGSDDLANP